MAPLVQVAKAVLEDVAEGVADFAGGGEDAAMMALDEEGAFAAEGAVDADGGADAERADAGAEGAGPVGLDHEVKVVVLDGVGDDAEVVAFVVERGEDAVDGAADFDEAKRALDDVDELEGEVDGMAGEDVRAGEVILDVAPARPTAPGEVEGELPRSLGGRSSRW